MTGVSVTAPNAAGPGAVSPAGTAIGRPAERLRHAEHVMGKVFSFDIPASAAAVLPEVVSWLHWVDVTFSTYRDHSDVRRFGRGELTLAQCAPELAEVVEECAAIRLTATHAQAAGDHPASSAPSPSVQRAQEVRVPVLVR